MSFQDTNLRIPMDVEGLPGGEISNENVTVRESNTNFKTFSGQFLDCPLGLEAGRTFNPIYSSILTVGTENLNMEREGSENQFGSQCSADLAMSQPMENPASYLNYVGIRKVKVKEVSHSRNGKSASVGTPFSWGESSTIAICTDYDKVDARISLGQIHNSGNKRTVSIGPILNEAEDDFIAMSHTNNKEDGDVMVMCHEYKEGDHRVVPMDKPFDKGNTGLPSTHHGNEKGKEAIMSTGPTYNKVREYNEGDYRTVPMDEPFDKSNANVPSTNHRNKKGKEAIMLTDPSHKKVHKYSSLTSSVYSKSSNNIMPMAPTSDKADGSVLSIHTSYEIGQSIAPSPGLNSNNDESNAPKNLSPSNFPSNVKSLLSTGILDGVPVKYYSWSREHNLKGIIREGKYLCGCCNCKFSKGLNPYEFERHAGCKTKHPNNHIYFQNGKSIYAVVVELKNTPQEMLFEAIENATGSPINQQNFRFWKGLYEAANREIQRIYGKDEQNTTT